MQDFFAKIKGWILEVVTPEIYTILIIMLVGFGSFWLGRLSAREENRMPVRIVMPEAQTSSNSDYLAASVSLAAPPARGAPLPTVRLSPGGLILASKSGTKYYFPWCAGVKRIAEANKTWFASEQEAQAAGLTLAANCKGNNSNPTR